MKETIAVDKRIRRIGSREKVEGKVLLKRFYDSSVKPYVDSCSIPQKCNTCDAYEIEGKYSRPFGDVVQIMSRKRRELPIRTEEERIAEALRKPRAVTARRYRRQRDDRRQSAEALLKRRRRFGLLAEPKDYSSFKVAELKDILRKRNLKVGGKKDDLIERLQISDARRGDFEMGEAPDVQQMGREALDVKRQKRSAFQRRKSQRAAQRPQTGVFVADPMARTGFRQTRIRSGPTPVTRIRREPTLSEIRRIQQAAVVEKPNYKDMKVSELRDELRERGLKVSGTKKELIKRLS
tara:strand:+ start:1783 stop:2664 length:882 start_codon:yes stop_codon:yes gene_type:complete